MAQKATMAQAVEVLRLIEAGRLSRKMVEAIIQGRVEIEGRKLVLPVSDATNCITVPDLSAVQLLEWVRSRLTLEYPISAIEGWDFVRDERGKTYEVEVWTPGCRVVPAWEVRPHFSNGFFGNTAAFIAWVEMTNPLGQFASIPEDDRLYCLGSQLRALNFERVNGRRGSFDSRHVRNRWGASWSFVAFREV